MKGIILDNICEFGFKSYCAYCSAIYENGLLSRIDTNEAIWQINLDREFLGSFVSQWFNDYKKAEQLFEFLDNPAYSYIVREITTPIYLGMLCLWVDRTNSVPAQLTNLDSNIPQRDKWLFGTLEELIQYPPIYRISPLYLNLPTGHLRFYCEIARLCPSEIIPSVELLSILEDYINYTNNGNDSDNDNMLNSIDEHGVIIWLDEETFGWADEKVRDKLKNLKYREELWSTTEKLVKSMRLWQRSGSAVQK